MHAREIVSDQMHAHEIVSDRMHAREIVSDTWAWIVGECEGGAYSDEKTRKTIEDASHIELVRAISVGCISG